MTTNDKGKDFVSIIIRDPPKGLLQPRQHYVTPSKQGNR
jgi:hypothetical protein